MTSIAAGSIGTVAHKNSTQSFPLDRIASPPKPPDDPGDPEALH